MATYQTKPRRQLLNFLAENPDQSFTADELAEALQNCYGPEAPGKSTVYRLVGKLVREEQIKRFEEEGGKRSLYQLTGCECHDHLHLKCTDCGKLIHMKKAASSHLLEDVLNSCGFTVDGHQTVLFGRCDHCSELIKGAKA